MSACEERKMCVKGYTLLVNIDPPLCNDGSYILMFIPSPSYLKSYIPRPLPVDLGMRQGSGSLGMRQGSGNEPLLVTLQSHSQTPACLWIMLLQLYLRFFFFFGFMV